MYGSTSSSKVRLGAHGLWNGRLRCLVCLLSVSYAVSHLSGLSAADDPLLADRNGEHEGVVLRSRPPDVTITLWLLSDGRAGRGGVSVESDEWVKEQYARFGLSAAFFEATLSRSIAPSVVSSITRGILEVVGQPSLATSIRAGDAPWSLEVRERHRESARVFRDGLSYEQKTCIRRLLYQALGFTSKALEAKLARRLLLFERAARRHVDSRERAEVAAPAAP